MADVFFLLRIHGDDGQTRFPVPTSLTVDVFERGITVGMTGGKRPFLPVRLERIPPCLQQMRHRRVADRIARFGQRRLQDTQALARPFPWILRVSFRVRR